MFWINTVTKMLTVSETVQLMSHNCLLEVFAADICVIGNHFETKFFTVSEKVFLGSWATMQAQTPG